MALWFFRVPKMLKISTAGLALAFKKTVNVNKHYETNAGLVQVQPLSLCPVFQNQKEISGWLKGNGTKAETKLNSILNLGVYFGAFVRLCRKPLTL